jgi:hypothetical protein
LRDEDSFSRLQNPAPPAAKKPGLTGWPLGLVIAGVVALLLRGLLAVFSLGAHHRAAGPAPMPTWPLKAGDIFTLKPGDPVIAKWAESPDSDGFIVQAIEIDGKRLAVSKVCALEPDYMADPAQPGGTLTLVAQDGTGDWSVHWHGGDTLPPSEAPQSTDAAPSDITSTGHTNANCGKDALFMMSQAQLHSWLDMQTGVASDQTQ